MGNKPRVKFDFSGAPAKGKTLKAGLRRFLPAMKRAAAAIRSRRDDGKMGFMYLPYDAKAREEAKRTAETFRGRFDSVVILGDKGPVPGMKAICRAVFGKYQCDSGQERRKYPAPYFPEGVSEAENLFERLDLKRSAVIAVDKRGNDPVVIAAIDSFMGRAGKTEKKERVKERVLVITGANESPLSGLCKETGFAYREFPDNVGEGFSLFSRAGLIPLAACGVDSEALLKGAALMDSLISDTNVGKNPASLSAACNYMHMRDYSRRRPFFYPEGGEFSGFSGFFLQVFSESCCAERRKRELRLSPEALIRDAGTGAIAGALINGPDDHFVTLVTGEERKARSRKPGGGILETGKPVDFERLAESRETENMLLCAKKPYEKITMSNAEEFALGQLAYFIMAKAVYLSEMNAL